MKPFDLKAAKAGNPVCTKDGRKVRILTFDLKSKFGKIVAAVNTLDGDEFLVTYDNNGKVSRGPFSDNLKLMMDTIKKQGWIAVSESSIHSSKSIAYCTNVFKTAEEARAASSEECITIPIEWEK